MLHQVLDGPCLESFGIPVAAMAGFPESVLIEAKRKFDCLEDPEGFGLPKGTSPALSSLPLSLIGSSDDPQKLQRIQDLMERFEAIPFDNLPRHEGGLRISEIRQEIRGIDTSPSPVAAAVASL
jgi:DNA mismatch repair protein MSH2